jgi:peroxiredoxin
LTDEQGVAIKAFGASKAPKGIIRSHIVIKKGGEVLDVQNKISPNDSFTSALETALENAK